MTTVSPNIITIILNWNGKNDTLHCLRSFPSGSEVIVVDNGSSDGSVAAIRAEFPTVTVLETGENLGFAGGNNVGIEYALKQGADWIFLLNNDTVVDPHIFEAFRKTASKQPEVGIWGAKIYLFDKPNQFDHFGGNWNPRTANFDLIGYRAVEDGKSWEKPVKMDYACGAALFIKKDVFEKIGLLEPRYFLFWEESDFCFRAAKAGFATFLCPGAKVRHKVSASCPGKAHTSYFWWRNRLLWIERNCSREEKRRLFFRVLLPELFKLRRHLLVKGLQLKLLSLFIDKTKLSERIKKHQRYRASWQGVKDYYGRRFGNAPPSIFK